MKALTFSFDDGRVEDKRLVALLNKYHLKATFNLNSGLFCRQCEQAEEWVHTHKIRADEVQALYAGHEVAAHTCTHPNLTQLGEEEEIVREIKEDVSALSALVGYPVIGFAYPGGGVNHDERVATIISKKTNIKYARTNQKSFSFELPHNLFCLHPTCHILDAEISPLVNAFLSSDGENGLFYIYGHSFEIDTDSKWAAVEALFAKVCHQKEVFYGTNISALRHVNRL